MFNSAYGDIFNEMFGFNKSGAYKSEGPKYEEPLNKELIDKLYSLCKQYSKYKLFGMKSGTFNIMLGNDLIESYDCITEAKREYIWLSTGNK